MTKYDLYLTKDDRKALKGSIEKWEGVVAGKESKGVLDCPLCQFYWNNCLGCPIEEWAGGCFKTPYRTYEDAQDIGDKKAMKAAAKEELAFLKDLLKRGIDY